MTSPISNTPPFYPIPEETTSFNEPTAYPITNREVPEALLREAYRDQADLIDEDIARTSKWEVVHGLYRRVCGLFPKWKVSRRTLLIEATGCLAAAIFITLATRCRNITIDSEMLEFIKDETEEVEQRSIGLIKNQVEEALQRSIEYIKTYNYPERLTQHIIEEKRNQTEEELQFYTGKLQNQTEKIMQIFSHPRLVEKGEHFGGFLWPTGVTFTMLAVGRTVMATLKPYFSR